MAQIANQANVSKALLYHYYPSKDALIFGIVHDHLVGLDAAVTAADDAALQRFLQELGYPWVEETANPAYRLFLGAPG